MKPEPSKPSVYAALRGGDSGLFYPDDRYYNAARSHHDQRFWKFHGHDVPPDPSASPISIGGGAPIADLSQMNVNPAYHLDPSQIEDRRDPTAPYHHFFYRGTTPAPPLPYELTAPEVFDYGQPFNQWYPTRRPSHG